MTPRAAQQHQPEEDLEDPSAALSSSTQQQQIQGRWHAFVVDCAADRQPQSTWKRERILFALVGCTSSSIVLAVRLVLDKEPLAYLIHSVIVFLDMVLIHIFTHSLWLSVAGELTTVAFFLAFHFTKATVFELLETTLIAVWCSFNLLVSRSKAMEKNRELEADLVTLRRNLRQVAEEHSGAFDNKNAESKKCSLKNPECRKKAKELGERLFEEFLDGSAGVMYTSFLGLIITELVRHASGETKNY